MRHGLDLGALLYPLRVRGLLLGFLELRLERRHLRLGGCRHGLCMLRLLRLGCRYRRTRRLNLRCCLCSQELELSGCRLTLRSRARCGSLQLERLGARFRRLSARDGCLGGSTRSGCLGTAQLLLSTAQLLLGTGQLLCEPARLRSGTRSRGLHTA